MTELERAAELIAAKINNSKPQTSRLDILDASEIRLVVIDADDSNGLPSRAIEAWGDLYGFLFGSSSVFSCIEHARAKLAECGVTFNYLDTGAFNAMRVLCEIFPQSICAAFIQSSSLEEASLKASISGLDLLAEIAKAPDPVDLEKLDREAEEKEKHKQFSDPPDPPCWSPLDR